MHWRDATPDDLLALAKKLRPEDLQEIRDAGFETPETALLAGLAADGVCHVGIHRGRVLCAMGVGEVSPGLGQVWMLGTRRLAKDPMLFARASRRWVAEQLNRWPVLYNNVWAKHEAAVKWLQWLGATLEKQNTLNDQPYWLFTISET